jgi:BirA family biotin operon repressor/biotin-[acetyl-CoA-carboxylase] ligase
MGIGALTIKRPNDLLAGGRKVAGILLENRQCGNWTTAVVAGLGLNVNAGPGDFPEHLAMAATSIRELTGQVVDRELLLQRLFRSFDQYYRLWAAGGAPAVRSAAGEAGISFAGFEGERQGKGVGQCS